jgi:hypothetical protein
MASTEEGRREWERAHPEEAEQQREFEAAVRERLADERRADRRDYAARLWGSPPSGWMGR